MSGPFFCQCFMLCDFENKVLDFIRAEQLFTDKGRLLLAVSGGADSVALMHTLWALKADRHINTQLVCAHLNHKLRGTESDADEKYVVSQVANLGIDITTRRLDVKRYAARQKLSLETAGRKWRIETLTKIAEQNGCACIATGHHKDDNAETIIQRLLRGCGFRGLSGIWPRRRFENGACFIRPLLCVSKDKIRQYLQSRGVRWREDSSNAEIEFRRNFIRHELIPEIQKQCTGPVSEQLWQLSVRMRRFQEYLQQRIEAIWQKLAKPSHGRVTLNLPAFQSQPELIKVELIRRSLLWLGSGERDLTEAHFNRVFEIAAQNVSNRTLELPDGFRLWREYKRLIFAAPQQSRNNDEVTPGQTIELNIPGSTRFGRYVIEADLKDHDENFFEEFKKQKNDSVEWFDCEKLDFPITIRFRRDGDKFTPLGMKEEKKVGQLLTDAQVPVDIRKEVLIISDAAKIIWVWPIRMSEQAKVTEDTRKLLQLSIKPL